MELKTRMHKSERLTTQLEWLTGGSPVEDVLGGEHGQDGEDLIGAPQVH
jgi:hypothetical protein